MAHLLGFLYLEDKPQYKYEAPLLSIDNIIYCATPVPQTSNQNDILLKAIDDSMMETQQVLQLHQLVNKNKKVTFTLQNMLSLKGLYKWKYQTS